VRKFGLAAILTFVDKGATAAMGRVGARAAALRSQFQGIGRGIGGITRGFGTVAMAAAPAAAGLGLMFKKGLDFEAAMQRVKAVTLDSANKTTPALKSLAKTLGATTKFSASQAAEAMENLARAGFSTKEIMGAIGGTLDAAAAEGIDLATAADMVASNVRAFGVEATEAAAIAGKLALASAKTNTNMVQLQEGLKFAAPFAKQANASLSDTVAVVGALSDIGLKGTLAGTAFRAGITRLTAPSKEARKAMGALGISMADVAKFIDKGDVIGAFQMVSKRLAGQESAAKRVGLAMKIFGARGAGVASAMMMDKKKLDRFNRTLAALRAEAGGTAKAMKDIQLDTLSGQLVILKSAFEGVSIELFGLISGQTRGLVERLSGAMGSLAIAMRVVSGEKLDPETAKQAKKLAPVYLDVARGIREAFTEIKDIFRGVGESLKGVLGWFGVTGEGGARNTAKIITKVVVLTAAFAPLGLAIAGVARLMQGFGQIAAGTLRTVSSTLGLVTKGVGGFLGKYASKVPFLAKILPKGFGALGKAVGAVEKLTAQPVRVVNFDEAGMGGLGGLGRAGMPSGARELDLATQTGGALGRFRAGLNGLAGRIPLVGGILTSNLSAVGGALGKAGLLGKLAGGGGLIAAIGAAGLAGWKFGSWLDQKFGLSKKISDWAWDATKKRVDAINEPLRKARNVLVASVDQAKSLNQLIEFRKRGITSVGAEGGKRLEITREMAQKRIVEGLQRNKESQETIAQVLKNVAPLLAKLPSAGGAGAGVEAPPRPAKDALISRAGLIPVSAGDVVLDRASLAQAVVSQMRGGLAGRAGGGALGGGDPGRTTPPPATASAPLRVEIPVTIDGRQVALAVAEFQLEHMERAGIVLKPGDRAMLLERGYIGGY